MDPALPVPHLQPLLPLARSLPFPALAVAEPPLLQIELHLRPAVTAPCTAFPRPCFSPWSRRNSLGRPRRGPCPWHQAAAPSLSMAASPYSSSPSRARRPCHGGRSVPELHSPCCVLLRSALWRLLGVRRNVQQPRRLRALPACCFVLRSEQRAVDARRVLAVLRSPSATPSKTVVRNPRCSRCLFSDVCDVR
jgi:hypothetical protein